MKLTLTILSLTFFGMFEAQTLNTALKNKDMLIGQRNELSLTIDGASNQINLPKKLTIQGVILDKKKHKSDTINLEINKIEKDTNQSGKMQLFHVSFTAWDTGFVTVLPIKIDSLQLNFPPSLLHVGAPSIDKQGDIKDIEIGKIDLDGNTKHPNEQKSALKFYIFAAFLLIVAGVLLYFILKKDKKEEEEPAIQLSLYEQTINNLNQLFAYKWWEKDMIKRHFIELTTIVRTYIGKRFEIEALEKTTNELKFALKSKNIPANQIDLLIQFLSNADLVKFAKQTLDSEEIVSINNQALLFVEITQEEEQENKDKKE